MYLEPGRFYKWNAALRIYISSLGTDPVYSSTKLQRVEGWLNINDVYSSPRIRNTSKISIEIMNNEKRHYVDQKAIPKFVDNFNLNPKTDVDVLYHPIWIDEYSNDNYQIPLKSNGYELDLGQRVFQPCYVDAKQLNDYLNN